MITFSTVQLVTDAYIEAMLWSTSGDDGDENLEGYELADETFLQCVADVCNFLGGYIDLVQQAMRPDYSWSNVGHDFWLTRAGHGAGFWDRGLGEVGDKLSDAARAFGNLDPYVDDDGRVHL